MPRRCHAMASIPNAITGCQRDKFGDRLAVRKRTITYRDSSCYPFDARLAVADVADDPALDPILGELSLNALGEVGTHDHCETDAAVEDTVHLGLWHVAQPLQPREHRRRVPTTALQVRPLA